MANLCGDLGVGGPPPPPMGLSISDSSVSDTRRSPQNGDEGLATMVVGDGGGGLSKPPHFRWICWNLVTLLLTLLYADLSLPFKDPVPPGWNFERNDSFKEQDYVELKQVFKVPLLSAFFNAISKMAALFKYEMIAVSSSTKNPWLALTLRRARLPFLYLATQRFRQSLLKIVNNIPKKNWFCNRILGT